VLSIITLGIALAAQFLPLNSGTAFLRLRGWLRVIEIPLFIHSVEGYHEINANSVYAFEGSSGLSRSVSRLDRTKDVLVENQKVNVEELDQ